MRSSQGFLPPIALVLTALLTFSAPVVAGSTVYEVTDLGTLPSGSYFPSALAWSINNAGEVVGYSQSTDGEVNAFLYRNGSITDIGASIGAPYSAAFGINSAGKVVGEFREFGSGSGPHAFLYSDGTTIDLGAVAGASNSSAQAINAGGQVVGYLHIVRGQAAFPFLYDKGEIRLLGVLPGVANDINERGEIVGYSEVPGIGSRAFLYSKGSMIDIGAQGAWGINNKGQVVGAGVRAFLFERGEMVDLGVLDGDASSVAFDINERGEVVGQSVGAVSRAFLYSDGTMMDLNDLLDPNSGSGWVLEIASAINDRGEIVGWGTFNGNTPRAFLLTPRANTH